MSDILNEFINITHEQIEFNTYKNIFCISRNQLSFNDETKKLLMSYRHKIHELSSLDKEYLIQFYVDDFINALYKANQYINFQKDDYIDIRQTFVSLLQDVNDDNLSLQEIEVLHFNRVRNFLRKTNPSIFELNKNENIFAKKFVCCEYSSSFQIDILDIDINLLKEPILDIGCGENGYLVEYFRDNNLKTYGIDRLHKNEKYFKNSNWLEFNYGKDKWGTIISNLSFTNHFIHHYLQNDKIDILYAKVYMKIIDSLLIGGKWIYAPSVPFIENLLPINKYQVIRTPINNTFTKTVITKLSK